MLERLAFRAAGLYFKNPIVIGSGPLTSKLSRIKKAEDFGASAVSLKHTMAHDPHPSKPRWYSDSMLGLVNPGDPRLTMDEGLELTRRVKESCNIVVLANMSGRPDSLESWADAARQFESAGADAIEVNFTCPNLGLDREGGIALGSLISKSPSLVEKIVHTVKGAVKIPVVPKLGLGSGSADPADLVRACEKGGADLVTITTTERAAPDIDIFNGGRPLVWGTRGKASFGAYAGRWKRLISCRNTAEAALNTRLPIIAGGGIFSAQDIVKTIMYGASIVHICYAVMIRGFSLIENLLKGLEAYLEKTGYTSLQDVRGMALNYIADARSMDYEPVCPAIDRELCNGCGICSRLGSCDAINISNGKAIVDASNCVGCGLCRGLCPKRAISMKTLYE